MAENDSNPFAVAVIALVSACVGAGATLGIGAFGYFNKNRDLDIKMIEIALGILREDPEKSKITATREWAVDLLDQYSGTPLNALARAELVSIPFKFSVPDSITNRGTQSPVSTGGGDQTPVSR